MAIGMAMAASQLGFHRGYASKESVISHNVKSAARLLLYSRSRPLSDCGKCRAAKEEHKNQQQQQQPQQQEQKEQLQLSVLRSLLQLERWEVPWGYGVTALGLCGWLVSFLTTGLATSALAHIAGFERREILDLDEQAAYILFSQVLQTVTSLGTINRVVKDYKPLPSDLFVFDLRKPFDFRRGWLLWGGFGIFCAAGAVFLSSMIVSSINNGELPPREEGDALSLLLPLIGTSPFSTASLIIVTGVLAPILEEVVFRGFLLTSLTKRLPVPVAVLISSAVFALAHLTPGEFPQLFALGLVIGFAYAKTHNLLTPVLIHAVWNSGVVVVLTALSVSGYDIRELLSN